MSASTQPGAAPTTTTTSAATAAKISSDATTALSAADATASQRVQNLNLVQQARLAQLTRTAASISARYGAGSPEAAAAEAKVTASKATIARVATVSQQVSSTAPQVSATGWALYGHVYNAQLQPVSAYTVFLVDAKKAYQSAYGFSYTDSTGYFLISFAGDPASSQNQSQQSSQLGSAGAPPPPQLFIEIANSNALPVYLSATAFQPTLGTATYQNITLPAGEPPIGDPPAEIRSIALPPTQRNP
jgi:hypothetical protein